MPAVRVTTQGFKQMGGPKISLSKSGENKGGGRFQGCPSWVERPKGFSSNVEEPIGLRR